MERTYTFKRFNVKHGDSDVAIADEFQFIGFAEGQAVFVKRELTEQEQAMADVNKEMAEVTADAQLKQAIDQLETIKEVIAEQAAEEARLAEEAEVTEETPDNVISLESLEEVLAEVENDEA